MGAAGGASPLDAGGAGGIRAGAATEAGAALLGTTGTAVGTERAKGDPTAAKVDAVAGGTKA